MVDDSVHQDQNTIASDKAVAYQSINTATVGGADDSGNIRSSVQPRIYINIPDGAKIKAIYINMPNNWVNKASEQA